MRSDGGKLRGRCDLCDAAAEMAEVLGTDLETQDLFHDGREVRQRADDAERRRIGGARQAPRGGQGQRVFDRLERHAALVQLGRQQTVRVADGAGSARSRTEGFQKPADIFALLQGFSLADRAAKDP